jgi:thiamine-monophosphate kinase
LPATTESSIINTIRRITGEDLLDDTFWEADTRRVFTTDLLIEGHHFDRAWFTPEAIGWKAAAVNLSDLAATGARPQLLLVSVGLPQGTPLKAVEACYQGLQAAASRYGARIVGGDTVSAPCWVINVTAVGKVDGFPGLRTGAMAGDTLWMTQPHGLSAVGLKALQTGHGDAYPASVQAHRHPEPQVEAGLRLAAQSPRYALMDTSDGLADAALKIVEASQVRIILEAEQLPVHPEVAQAAQSWGGSPLDWMLYGGEDFDLLASARECVSGFFPVGQVEAGEPGAFVRLSNGELRPLSAANTYQHFAP